MEQHKVEFEEEGHIYRVNGRRVISTTQALALVDDRPKDLWYLLRGKIVHRVTQYYDNGELNEESVDLLVRPYFEAYVKFRGDTGFVPIYVEKRLYHPSYVYCGTLDRIGKLNKNDVLIDLKSGAKARVDELQLAAYWELARVNNIPVKKCFDLYLHDNATYKLEPVENVKLLLPTFLSILKSAQWKENLT